MRSSVEGEVDQVSTVGRQITTVFVNAAAQPLSEGELVRAAVPKHAADLLGRPAPKHQSERRFSREDHVQTSGGFWFHGRNLGFVPGILSVVSFLSIAAGHG